MLCHAEKELPEKEPHEQHELVKSKLVDACPVGTHCLQKHRKVLLAHLQALALRMQYSKRILTPVLS